MFVRSGEIVDTILLRLKNTPIFMWIKLPYKDCPVCLILQFTKIESDRMMEPSHPQILLIYLSVANSIFPLPGVQVDHAGER